MLTIAVEGGRLACEHVAVSRRPGGPRVTSAALRRLPVDTLAVVAARAVMAAQDPAEDDPAVLFARMRERPPGWEAEDVAHLPEAVRVGMQVRERRGYSDPPAPAAALNVMADLAQPERRPRASDPDALLRQVVAIYRKALTGSNPDRAPRKAVADKLNLSPTYVGKLLVEARKRGLLGPALDGRAGEDSTRATKNARKR